MFAYKLQPSSANRTVKVNGILGGIKFIQETKVTNEYKGKTTKTIELFLRSFLFHCFPFPIVVSVVSFYLGLHSLLQFYQLKKIANHN